MGLAETSRTWVEDMCGRLQLTPPCGTLEDVVVIIAAALGHPIDISLHDMEGTEIYGFCMMRDGRYKIAVSCQATRRQFVRTIVHELVHILRGDVTPTHPSVVYCESVTLRDPHELHIEACAQALVSYLRTGRPAGRDEAGAPCERGLARFWDELGGFDG